MKEIVRRLRRYEVIDDHTLDELIEKSPPPWADDKWVTFYFRGDADEVRLRHFIFGLPTSQPLVRIPNTDQWILTVEIPPESRVEYKFEIIHGEKGRWIQDPLNPRLAFDPFGANSVCHGEGYESPKWTQEQPDVRRGTLTDYQISSKAFGDMRHFSVYLPSRYREHRRYPLLICHDGRDYLRFASMKTALDNLMERNEVAPLIVAFSHPGNRLDEYPDDSRHQAHIVEELLPFLKSHFPVYQDKMKLGLMGASFGGVATLSTAWRYPDVFGNLLLQSGSFAFTDIGTHSRGAAFDPVVEFMNQFRADPGKPAERAFLSCGMYETLIYENRSMLPFLQGLNMQIRYSESRDGHNWVNWRDQLREGLSYLFPGPLWMFYE